MLKQEVEGYMNIVRIVCLVIFLIGLPIALYKDNIAKFSPFLFRIMGIRRGIPTGRVDKIHSYLKKMCVIMLITCIAVIPSYFKIWTMGAVGKIVFLITLLMIVISFVLIFVWGICFLKELFHLVNEWEIFDYKTYEDSSIRGKQNVLYCGAFEDEESNFEKLTAEIFKNHKNVAIQKIKESNVPMSKWEKTVLPLLLSEINLVIIPVTRNFLYTENDARCVILPTAKEENIPILPFIIEDGIEAEFNRICGGLELLSTNITDVTAISYEEKLEKFLDSVLFSDNLVERIRQAFDAYVFISYRKRDRKYANEIMHLIHANPFCRDVAIWYDEFLVPGENFDDAIKEACKKSQLFTMIVTPNVLDNPNYVKDKEYPFARENNMDILPVMMEATNRKSLEKSYPSIPDCVVPGDDFDAALKTFFEERARKNANINVGENADGNGNAHEDPEHLFFIGLAYLNGIDVEKNPDMAADMLARAAEGGVAEAYEKLIQIYRHGNGVKRSTKDSILWRDKYCDFLIEEAHKTDNRELLSIALQNMIVNYNAKYYSGEKDLKDDFAKIEKIRASFAEKDEDLDEGLRAMMSLLYYTFSEYECEEGSEESMKYIGKTDALLDTLKNAEHQGRLGMYVYFKNLVGKRYFEKGDMSYAKTCYEQAHEVGSAIAEENGSMQDYRNLEFCYRNLGRIAIEEGDIYKAKELMFKALDIIKTLNIEYNVLLTLVMVQTMVRLGEAFQDVDDSEAIYVYNAMYETLQSIRDKIFDYSRECYDEGGLGRSDYEDLFNLLLTTVYLKKGLYGEDDFLKKAEQRINAYLAENPEDEYYLLLKSFIDN